MAGKGLETTRRPRYLTDMSSLSADLIAGLTNALVYIPQGIAYALVAGVSPVHGLYTGIIAPLVGALTAGSSFIVIIATNELAIPTSSIIAALGGSFTVYMLFTLTLLMGLFQLVFGILKLGSLTRFVSESVMTGFFSGVAVLLVLTQLDKLTGYKGGVTGNALIKFWDWFTHLNRIDLATTAVGLMTIVAILLLQRSRLKTFAFILAIVFAAIVAAVLGQPSIALLGGVGEIPSSLPSPVLPDFGAIPHLLLPALSLAIVGLAVAAGVSQSYPEPDGSTPNASRDFVGQGAANLVGSFFQAMPAGGSFSRTATSVSAGARTRLANVFLSVILAIVLVTIGGMAKYFPMAALAGLLMVIGYQALKPERIARVRHTHVSERVAMLVTFALTLLIPLQYAIFAGVFLTLGLYVYSSSTKIRIVEIAPTPDGRFIEQPAPAEIPSHKTTILHVYGNAFFAAVYTLEQNLPSIDKTTHAAVIFSARGHDAVTTTFWPSSNAMPKSCKPAATEQTNGTRVDDEWSVFFKAHTFLVGLSIDGPRQMHDAYRVDKGGKGSFDQVMRGWEFLTKHSVDTNIMCTVHAANADHPLEDYRLFRDELKTEFIQFIHIIERVTAETLPIANLGWGELVVPASCARGVIAQGSSVGGWTLYTKDGKLKYCYNFFGAKLFHTEATQTIPAGKHQVRMEFKYDGGGLAKGGAVARFVDGKQVGQGRVDMTQPVAFSADETCDVGNEAGSPVLPDYGPHGNAFSGEVNWVQINLEQDDHDHLISPEERFRVAMARQ